MHIEEIEGRDNHSGPTLALDDVAFPSRACSFPTKVSCIWDADSPAFTCVFLRRRPLQLSLASKLVSHRPELPAGERKTIVGDRRSIMVASEKSTEIDLNTIL
jgi:hypothetical protein